MKHLLRTTGIFAAIMALLAILVAPAYAAPAFEVDLDNDVDEVQEVFVDATAGQFGLSFEGQATGGRGSGDLTLLGTGSGKTTAGSNLVGSLVTSTGAFAVGASISGPGIPARTTIAKIISPTELELTAKATSTASGVALVSGSRVVSNLSTSSGAFVPGEEISGAGIPAGTTIAKVLTPSQLELSDGATAAAATAEPLAADLAFGTGQNIDTTGKAIEAALNALPAIAAGGGSVNVEAEIAGAAVQFFVHFDGGPLAQTDVPELTASNGPVPLSGGVSLPPIRVSTSHGAHLNRGDERIEYTVAVKNVGNEATGGPVTLEVELPGGAGSYVLEIRRPTSSSPPEGWICSQQPAVGTQPAKVICVHSNTLAPGGFYPGVRVAAALGADAPDQAIATATVSGGGALGSASDSSEFTFGPPLVFGAEDFDAAIFDSASNPHTQAGGHPFQAKANFTIAKRRTLRPFNNEEVARYRPVENTNHVIVDTPPGFVGNARALPVLCPTAGRLAFGAGGCPPESAVGGIDLYFNGLTLLRRAIYAVEPEFGTAAEFAFAANENIYTFVPQLRPGDGYAISFVSAPVTEGTALLKATPEICDFGAKVSGSTFAGCKEADEAGANPLPLITNPTSCNGGPPIATLRLDSWAHPGAVNPDGSPNLSDPDWKSKDFANPPITGCDAVEFEPQADLRPTSKRADSPTGLEVDLSMPTAGLEGKDDEGNVDPDAVAQANLRTAKVSFPEGMAVNATAGQGLGACSAQQVKLGTNEPISCPDASKIGTVEIETPLIEDTLEGSVYIAKQGAIGGALVGFYLVFDSPVNGILIKIPARVDFDPQTGRLVSTVEDSPQQPFSAVRIRFAQGPRSPLLTPPRCGTYEIEAELTPWTGGASVTDRSSFQVTEGPDGGPCPNGALQPKLLAGVTNPVAGQPSPFVMQLSRDDGTDRFAGLNLTTPPGLSAYLKGVPYCPDATLASIPSAPGSGQAELDSPSCPAASRIGTVVAGAGAGANPLYVDGGKAYLAGPYKGAPLSIAVVAPAVAGPLDLGNVVVRNALYLNPETAQVSVVSDPIPTILHGILLDVRDIRVAIDRPNFTLNPTSCEPMAVGVSVKGMGGGSASASSRFQVGGCERLSFGPKLSVRLFGGTGRGAHPRLTGTLQAGPGEANIANASVTIPKSEFLDQSHIRTICTRVQFAADACPPGSIYGHATATTPLLDYPVEGPVYLRSSDHKLPDLVVALKGPAWQPIEAVVVGRVDSIRGQIRTTFEAAPDVPVTKFTLQMQGGKKGLLVNSRNICKSTNRATVELEGHNGMEAESRPALRNGKCGKAKGKKRRR